MAASADSSSRVSRARLVSTYYDTPDHALARRGSSLRLRRRGKRVVQTVKTVRSSGAGALSRGEWDDQISDDRPDPRAAQTGGFLPPEIAERLRPMFRTEISRLTIPLTPEPSTRIEAAIDRGRICNGGDTPAAPISEVELELKSGSASALYDVALELLRIVPLRLERRSKAERGYQLAAHKETAVKPVHAPPVELHAGLTGEAALRRIAHACLDHLLCNEDAALAGEAEGIHQMRVAVRRLRASLSTFAPMLPPDQRRWASQELRWLADALGEARNLDVFSGSLLPPARAALPDASEFERLSQAAERRRRDAHAGMVQAIGSTRYTEALLALFRWLDGLDWRSTGDAAPCDEPIEKLAPLLLDRCRAQAEKRATDFVKQSPRKRHRLRIALKKLRYAAEMLGSLYDAAATRVFIQRLKRLQDDLGDANDVSVARDIIKSLAPDRRSTGIAYAGHRMLAWHNQRLAESEPRTRQHLNELLAAAPFWPVTES